MKKTKLIVALLLVLVMLVSAFTACDNIAGLFGGEDQPGEDQPQSCQKICSVCRCCYDPDCTEADHDIKCECIVSEELAIAQAKRAIATNYTLEKAVTSFQLPKAFPIKAYDAQRNEKTYEFALTWSFSYVEEEHLECITLDSESDPDNVIVTIKYEFNFNTVATPFKLSVAIAGASTSDSVELASVVPVFAINTYADYVAAGEGDDVIVEGTVTANYGEFCNVYLADADGAYYCYSWSALSSEAAKSIVPGDHLMVMGTKTIYQGTHELKDVIIISDDHCAEAIPAAKDATELFVAAENAKDASIVALQSQLVTIKGVTILPIDDEASKSGYYKFTIGNVSSYMRRSSSANILTAEQLDAFVETWAEHADYKADITGFVSVYGSAVYLLPAGNYFANPVAPELTRQERVDNALENSKFAEAIGLETFTEYELPTNGTGELYEAVAFAWDFKADTTHTTAAINQGKLVFTLGDEAETVTLVLTASLEGAET